MNYNSREEEYRHRETPASPSALLSMAKQLLEAAEDEQQNKSVSPRRLRSAVQAPTKNASVNVQQQTDVLIAIKDSLDANLSTMNQQMSIVQKKLMQQESDTSHIVNTLEKKLELLADHMGKHMYALSKKISHQTKMQTLQFALENVENFRLYCHLPPTSMVTVDDLRRILVSFRQNHKHYFRFTCDDDLIDDYITAIYGLTGTQPRAEKDIDGLIMLHYS